MRKDILYIIIAALLSGFIGIFNRLIDLPPAVQTFYRLLIAGLFLLSLSLYKKEKLEIKIGLIISIAVLSLSFAGSATFFNQAVKMIPIAQAAFIFYINPILITLLAPYILKEKNSPKIIIALIVAVTGLYLILLPNLQTGTFRIWGILAAFAGMICYSSVVLSIRRINKNYNISSIRLTALQCLIGSLFLSPFILTYHYTFGLNNMILLLMFGLIVSGVGISLMIKGLQTVSASRSSILFYIEPLSAVLYAFFFFGEKPGVTALLGGALVIASGIIIALSHNDTIKTQG